MIEKGLSVNTKQEAQSKFVRLLRSRFAARNPYGKHLVIGVLRPNRNPPLFATTLAAMGPQYHIKIVYFTPHGVHPEMGVIHGKVLAGSEWMDYVGPVPKVIDASPYCFKKANREVIEFLDQRSYLTYSRATSVTKNKLHQLLAQEPEFAPYAITTRRVNNVSGLLAFVRTHGKCVVKPVYSQRGAGVYYVSRGEGDSVCVGLNTSSEVMSFKEFEAYAAERFLKKLHIMQKYVSSRSVAGDPFDCRVHVEKDGSDTWRVARMFIRVGIGQQVISNVNQGGGIADVEPFLKANRPDCWKDIIQNLNRLATTFPYYYEELRGRRLAYLGVDVGIAEDGSLSIFECNGSPATDAVRVEAALLRLPHYRFLYEHVVKGKEPYVPRRPWREA